ncbi:PREDICTED: coiled-coil domain-containing protein CG32809-like isoform X11 [Acropora digitifera]|uniref:coiled-coil domain-containing protein CG32809-like isoform X11 n=1 Tax=Acropora digitifera TaxID=70779 RepID=UPI00077ACF57|nr:PREDICTED: coiled-coil domain-containing protein CG32809-like isoform X11 [Acropora digitifera]
MPRNVCMLGMTKRRNSLSKDTATSVSDSEAKGHGRRPRRRTTGGSDVEKDLERAKRLQQQGQSSEHDTQAAQTLSRQQIISMVKKRFGLRADEVGENKANGVQGDIVAASTSSQVTTSSPKQQRYQVLLDRPGTYPTMPRKEENHVSHTTSTPGVVYLQFGDEIKRAMLPAGLGDMSQVQTLFNQTFPDKIKDHGANRRTIYIKDNSCGVFYELDNVSDLSNKSHLKVLESRPFQNGPLSHHVSSPSAIHTGAHVTSTPLPNNNYIPPADAIHSGGGIKYTRTTTLTRQPLNGGPSVTTTTRVFNHGDGENVVSHPVTSELSLMDKKKVPLPGLGTMLKPRRQSHDSVEDQLDSLTNMLQEALKTGSQSSLPGKSTEDESPSSSQSSFIDHGSTEAGKSKPVPAPPPRVSSHAVSRESSLKHSHTMQRDSTRGAKRDITQQFHSQTLPLPSSKRTLADSPTPLSSNSSASSGSHASVKYEGRVKDRRSMQVRASTLRGDIKMLRADLNKLKLLQTFQAQQFDEMMRQAKERLVQQVSRISQAETSSGMSVIQKIHVDEMAYVKSKNNINRQISELESEVEMVRLDVVQKRCIGNPAEVEGLNSQLSIISRQVSDLKSEFAGLHDKMKSNMASELEIIVQGDKFLKEEPSKLESLVCRCKHITGTLFTLQKLVSAQQQMKSESEASFSSLEDVDKEVIESIRSVQRDYLQQRGFEHHTEDSKAPSHGRGRQKVRFYDEVTQVP